jgi:hypothetical protein
MILVDTGPLVALFDPLDGSHIECRAALASISEPLCTTVPVLTEAFHMLRPASIGSDRLRTFVLRGGLSLWFFTEAALERAFELMAQYADQDMDLADASLVTAAEAAKTRTVFTLDYADFTTYRIQRGHRYMSFELIP